MNIAKKPKVTIRVVVLLALFLGCVGSLDQVWCAAVGGPCEPQNVLSAMFRQPGCIEWCSEWAFALSECLLGNIPSDTPRCFESRFFADGRLLLGPVFAFAVLSVQLLYLSSYDCSHHLSLTKPILLNLTI